MAKNSLSRREFLSSIRGASLVAFAASGIPLASLLREPQADAAVQSCTLSSLDLLERADQAYRVREQAARRQRDLPMPEIACNSDELIYVDGIASFTKSLPHNHVGEVRYEAFAKLLAALASGNPDDFEQIPLGGSLRLKNPQAAFAYELEGPDSHHMGMPAHPSFISAEAAGEMVEIYWQALTRDIPFAEYVDDPTIAQAAQEMSRLKDFRGPKQQERVTPATLFRGNMPGDLAGPYLSQFLWQPILYGAMPMEQKLRSPIAGDDYLTGHDEWLDAQNGNVSGTNRYQATPRYIRNNRDLAEYVHRDVAYQAYLSAAFILMGMGTPLNPGNPYLRSPNQEGFATFGEPHLFYLFGSVTNRALKCAWFQKWLVGRRLRPEEFGGRIHHFVTGDRTYVIQNDVLDSAAIEETATRFGTFLVPQAYPEGCPAHPAYPAGHATMAGACVTLLKAYFDESFVIPSPVVAGNDGLELLPYSGPDLTVGGELNKLASNISLGRDAAGIHYRSDGVQGLYLGEAVAISVLQELRVTYHENFMGFTFTKFDGTRVTL